MIRREAGKMTSAELVAAVEAAGLADAVGDPAMRAKLDAFLDARGVDALDWIRAKADLKLTAP